VFAPGLDPVAVTGNGLGRAVDPGLGADEIERDLLGALAALYVCRILVFMDTMYNRVSL
jgi:hypothetical protein